MLQNKISTLTFLTKFLLIVIILQLAVYFLQSTPHFSNYIQGVITNVVGFSYNMIDSSVVIDNNLLMHRDSPHFLIVDNSCTGLMLLASVFAAILAFENSWQVKIKMIVVSALILQCENIIRIMHLLYVIKYDNNAFDFYHLYVWQTINFVTALIVLFALDKCFMGKRQNDEN